MILNVKLTLKGQVQTPQIDTFRRDEVNLVINQQNELVRTIRDI